VEPKVPKPYSELCLVGAQALTIEAVGRVARGEQALALSAEPRFHARIERGAQVIESRLKERVPTYGVNTGFGASVRNAVPEAQAALLAQNLPRYHGCGIGPMLSERESRAVMLVRLASLAAGYSGVRPLVLERLVACLGAGVSPLLPSRGSVGASGDLTPLSYIAALLTGERDAWHHGRVMTARAALSEACIEPIVLGPKESLAIMNGTSVMGALACLAFERSLFLSRVTSLLTAMAVYAMDGQRSHFDARLFAAKPHPGQALCAAWMRADLEEADRPSSRETRIQERYSIRCAPHVIGVLLDTLPFARRIIETEINGASDNPLVDPESGDVLHGGNFYGGHIAMIADTLKTQVANLADLMDRQLVLLNEPATNGGLPENLVRVTGPARFAHHGFKAMEISASALTAEALKLCMPASVFSRSTEGHNQDKVSMGSIAVLDLGRILDLTETVAALQLLAVTQAVELRGLSQAPAPIRAVQAVVRAHAAALEADRPMDRDIEAVLALIRQRGLPVGPVAEPT
jgi:histidine ammonia-lyase